MEWVVETDLDAYADRVLPWFARDPVRTTLPATLLVQRREGLLSGPEPWLAWLADGGEVAGAALRPTTRGLVVPPLPAGAGTTLAAVAPPGLPRLSAPREVAAELLAAYPHRTAEALRRHTLYRLGELVPPDVAGALRPATDAEVAADWYAAFADAVGETRAPDARAVTARIVAQRRMWFWTVDGEPVCLVGHSPTVAGVARIGPVWTPPEHRRHGYAAAATAAVAALLRPAEVVLFAEDGNPTAVGVYTRLGFRPVGGWGEWRLEY
jgi:GNAT superfamily N-acetyltransferase